ncbi:MAG: hypothetical protein U0798_20245 [Gemmataceae bacterium]
MNPRLLLSLSIAVWVALPSPAQTPKVPVSIDPVVGASSADSSGLLMAPVDARSDSRSTAPRPDPLPIPSQDIRTVRAEIPDDLPKPARMTGVRTASGEVGVQGTANSYDPSANSSNSPYSKVDPKKFSFAPARRTVRPVMRRKPNPPSMSRSFRMGTAGGNRTDCGIFSKAIESCEATIASAT